MCHLPSSYFLVKLALGSLQANTVGRGVVVQADNVGAMLVGKGGDVENFDVLGTRLVSTTLIVLVTKIVSVTCRVVGGRVT